MVFKLGWCIITVTYWIEPIEQPALIIYTAFVALDMKRYIGGMRLGL